MADTKISALTAVGTAAGTDEFAVNQGGVSKKATLAQVSAFAVASVAGSSFPGSPSTGDRYFRTDRGIEYFYDGTRWLSTQLFYAVADRSSGQASSGVSYASVISPEDTDKWLEDFTLEFFIDSGGTALSGSHKWEVRPRKHGTGTTNVDLGSLITIDSGSSAVWRVATKQDLDVLMGTTYGALGINMTKTGTPGNLRPQYAFTYRLVG